MKLEKEEIEIARNIMKLVKRGKYQLSGEEAMAVVESLKWLSDAIKEAEKPDGEPDGQ